MDKKTPDSLRFAAMLGGNLKYLRLRRKIFMPQKVPAAHVGVRAQQLAKYENGTNIPCAYRLTQLADFFKVTVNDLVNPSFIHEQTKGNEPLSKAIERKLFNSFDATKYEQFDDEYPPGSGGLEHDPKMRATYDAILEDK